MKKTKSKFTSLKAWSRAIPLIALAALLFSGCPDPLPTERTIYDISLSDAEGHSFDALYTFPEEEPGYTTTTPLEVIVTNTGNQPTGTLTAEFTNGADIFTLIGFPIASLAPGATGTFTVEPKGGFGTGFYHAGLNVRDDSSNANAFLNIYFTVSFPPLAGTIAITNSGNSIATAGPGDTLTATYYGEEPVTFNYQWNKDGTPIDYDSGGNNATYTPTEEGDYTVTIRAENYKPKTSAAVTFSFPDLEGAITISPDSGVTTHTTLNASYGGSETVTYQWNKEGTGPLSGETNTSYTPTEAGNYTVTASAENYHSKTSDAVTVSFSDLAGDVTFSPSGSISVNTPLTAAYDGNEDVTLTYQWYKDGSPISSGGTSATYTPTATGSYTVTVRATGYNSITSDDVANVFSRTNASIKDTFRITATGTQGVTDTFNAVHTYLQGETGGEESYALIQLGDWIDLPSLIVAGVTTTNVSITPYELPYDGYEGRLLRLIVVGINSFGERGDYPGTTSSDSQDLDDAAHLVFQFQNLPFSHRMSATNINEGGYPASELKTWLEGDFTTAMTTAGVPSGVVFKPVRSLGIYVDATYPSPSQVAVDYSGYYWLPTELEMFGERSNSINIETETNQARLEYYDSNDKRIKFGSSSFFAEFYWVSSPYFYYRQNPSDYSDSFCCVNSQGHSVSTNASNDWFGVAPAFCIW